jgi:hypothetical protein
MTSATIEDVLRLTACPACGYSLEALPREGTCPECGGAYDRRFIVVQDDTGTESEPVGRRRRRLILGGLFYPALAFYVVWLARRGHWDIIWWLLPLVAMLAIFGWSRLSTPIPARKQLWMCAEGFEQIMSTEEARSAVALQQFVSRYGMPLSLLLFGLLFPRGHGDRVVYGTMTLILLPFAMVGHLLYRRGDRRVTVTSGSYTRRLIPWNALERWEVTSPKPGRVKIRFRRRVPFLGVIDLSKEWCALIDTAMTPEQVDALAGRLQEWRWGTSDRSKQ